MKEKSPKANETKEKEFYLGDFCVCCGKPVPEGTMVCFECEKNAKENCERKIFATDEEENRSIHSNYFNF